jgi:hypothetical protein
VVKIDTLLKRLLNLGDVKSYERIQTVTGSETMTSTQACRFRELQGNPLEKKRGRHKVKSHYTLKEAARILRTEVDDILASAVARRAQCLVRSEGLRGHWRTTKGSEPRMPEYLALTPADCQQLAAYSSVNVYDLEHPRDPLSDGAAISTAACFVLREPIWIDQKRIVLQHPLPK